MEEGDLAAAEANMVQLLSRNPDERRADYILPGLRGFQAHFTLAIIFRDQKRLTEAETEFLAVVSEEPGYSDAWMGLGELYLAQGLWEELDSIIQQLQADPRQSAVASVLKARRHLTRKEFGEARQLLEETIARFPHAPSPRLTRVILLLEEGRDLAACETGVRDLLKLDSGNLQACEIGHRLAAIYRQQGRNAQAEGLWQVVLHERPDSVEALFGLGGLYREFRRWEDVQRIIGQMEHFPRLRVDAALLQARTCLDRNEFSAARSLLENAVAQRPQIVMLRVALADVLLLEGRDWLAAENALRDVLALAPDHAPSRNKLTMLLSQRRHATNPNSDKNV